VLNNALDFLTIREFEGKAVGLVGVSGGPMGGASTLNTLRAIGRTLHAWVMPSEAWIYDADSAFSEDGHIITSTRSVEPVFLLQSDKSTVKLGNVKHEGQTLLTRPCFIKRCFSLDLRSRCGSHLGWPRRVPTMLVGPLVATL
jgi:hypothetical protein